MTQLDGIEGSEGYRNLPGRPNPSRERSIASRPTTACTPRTTANGHAGCPDIDTAQSLDPLHRPTHRGITQAPPPRQPC